MNELNKFYENVIEEFENEESVENIVKPKQKNIANCTTIEFLKQANKIRREVKNYLDVTKIMEIRKNKPDIETNDTKETIKEKLKKQTSENLNQILDACLEEHTEETIKIIGLACFKTPEEAENMPVSELFDVAFEIINSERVIDFFTKLVKSGLINMQSTSQA